MKIEVEIWEIINGKITKLKHEDGVFLVHNEIKNTITEIKPIPKAKMGQDNKLWYSKTYKKWISREDVDTLRECLIKHKKLTRGEMKRILGWPVTRLDSTIDYFKHHLIIKRMRNGRTVFYSYIYNKE